jgi:putative transposase
MSRTISSGIGKPYGLERVCRVLGFPRLTIYAARARESSNVVPLLAQRRGPKPKMPDADLLNAIRADLAASPFIGEGHRKVWARLRILRDIRVSRTRVLRLMRENALLSPHRRPRVSRLCTTARSRPARTKWGTPTACASRPWMTAGSGCSRRLIIAMPAALASMRSDRQPVRRLAADRTGTAG